MISNAYQKQCIVSKLLFYQAIIRSVIFYFTIYPIINVPSPLIFAAKIIAVTAVSNAIGIAIFALGERRRDRHLNLTA